MNYHYGKIQLNEAIIAIRLGNIKKGEDLLAEAEDKIKRWNELQASLAMAYLLLHEESKAVAVIREAISQNPNWKENLPAFYLLRDEPGMNGLIDEKRFSEKDWASAISFLSALNRDEEAAVLARKALQQFPASSYLHFLLGKALLATGKQEEAKKELQQAVHLDLSNYEAIDFLQHTVRQGDLLIK
jgi:predicted Zn-dependent protease